MKYLVANLKAHFNKPESHKWIDTFSSLYAEKHLAQKLKERDIQVLLAPSYPFLDLFSQKIRMLTGVSLCAQDVSAFDSGSYTGEVPAHALEGLVTHVILGHSERRTNQKETSEIIRSKSDLAKRYYISPILCISHLEDYHEGVADTVAFEPQDAIGSGHTYPLEDIHKRYDALKLKDNMTFIYGGGVEKDDIQSFAQAPYIGGLLVGTAALDPAVFIEIVQSYAS